MPSRYTITEPHPTVAQNTYIHAGRGGAGNHFRAPLTTSPAGVPTPIHPVATNGRRFYSGRGGAGNAHSHIERPVLSFEDEFSRADRRGQAQARFGYHVGRGGAGNFASGLTGGPAAGSSSSSKKSRQGSASSSSSSGSSAGSGVLRRLSGVFGNKH
ncbi:hypothetical protein M406DRAFT_282324 [Cryphonectria parasitica EP155]|uniref:Uncharacterized protein n=1 Tax=Cryphonectria parasitica (strain ATCC 38755 / EP155) TaxID=660469 RepID=A0A9P5CI84_CRYP1|nr:uncharacterized protein M406DRAFT_282324 [Cryphonectria parasitica EP155]KAF3760579.1 hypothetical protein M406DRAFT_282324 [Cryphonectria parasitica EP155]